MSHELTTFHAKHGNAMRDVIVKGKNATKTDVTRLKKHLKDSKKYESTLERAIKGYNDNLEKILSVRKGHAMKSLFNVLGNKAHRLEAEALQTLADAHANRIRHLEEIRQTRGEAQDFIKKYK